MKLINRVLEQEGLYTEDHAGPTKYGITIPALESFKGKKIEGQNIKDLTRQEAIEYYRWLLEKNRITEIIDIPLAYIIFDSMVNHGPTLGIKMAQRIAGVKADGKMGPITIASLNADPKAIYIGILEARFKLYASLASSNPNKYLKYLNGWIRRACKFIKEI